MCRSVSSRTADSDRMPNRFEGRHGECHCFDLDLSSYGELAAIPYNKLIWKSASVQRHGSSGSKERVLCGKRHS